MCSSYGFVDEVQNVFSLLRAIFSGIKEHSPFFSVKSYVVKREWVIPEKIHTAPMDGILEILTGGGVKDSGNPGGRGG